MKGITSFLFILLVACSSSENTETKEIKTYNIEALSGVWWNEVDSFVNGLQLDPNATLHYPNIYSLTGIQWRLSNDTLYFLERSLRDTSLEESFLLIHDLRNDTLEVKRSKEDKQFLQYTKNSSQSSIDTFLGRWTGVEGSFVDIVPKKEGYIITMARWDSKTQSMEYESYPGYLSESKMTFKKNGVEQTITLTDGSGSGMKWLQNAKLCIKISSGDGYCKY